MDHTVVALANVFVDLQPAVVIFAEGLGQDGSGGVAGVIDPGVSLGQVEIDEAPGSVGTDDIAGVGISVDNLPGQLGIQLGKGVQIRPAEGVGQMQVNAKIGLTFADGLRTLVRQDPDVILVGEMRDLETIAAAITAAETLSSPVVRIV
mgnify:CR=1 FL=1